MRSAAHSAVKMAMLLLSGMIDMEGSESDASHDDDADGKGCDGYGCQEHGSASGRSNRKGLCV